MLAPAIPKDESDRLAALAAYHVLDTPPEKPFNDIALLVAHVLDVPIALVSFVDGTRQWFKARYGLDTPETSRDISFCGHVVAEGQVLLVADAAADARFSDNPLVTGSPNIRSYAGVPLKTAGGQTLGTLCAIDRKVRNFDPKKIEMLQILAGRVMEELDLRSELVKRRQLTKLVEKAPMFLALATLEGAPTYLNQEGRRWLGLSLDANLPKSLSDFHTPAAWAAVKETGIPAALIAGSWSAGMTFLRKDGEVSVDELLVAESAGPSHSGFLALCARERGDGKA